MILRTDRREASYGCRLNVTRRRGCDPSVARGARFGEISTFVN